MSKATAQPELFPLKDKLQDFPINQNEAPQGWQSITIGKIGEVFSGGTPSTTEAINWNGEINWCTPTDITVMKEGRYLYKTTRKITEKGLANSSAKILPPGSIIVCTRATIGDCVINKESMTTNQGFKSIVPNSKVVDSEFLYYVLLKKKPELLRLAAGSTFLEISKSDFESLQIHLPPLPEQRKIAAILNTWDTAIDTTEKLIAAKEQLKKGLMQRLLTGKLRFREFKKGTWKEMKLGEVFIERKEIGYSHLELLAITGSGGVVKRDTLEKRDSSAEDKGKYLRILPGDIGYNTMRMWQGVSGVSSYEGIISPAYTVVIPTDEIDAQFMGYLFKFPPMVYLFWRYSQGLVDDTLNCKYDSFSRIHIHVPKKVEQQKIASVLSGCDHEIQLLKTQLVALKRQKKGLMQQLLTGRVRVKVEEDKSVVAV